MGHGRRRVATAATALTLLVSILAPAAVADTGPGTPHDQVSDLAATLANGDKHAVKAGEKLAKALRAEYWDDSGWPVTHKVFEEMRKAAKELAKSDSHDATAAELAAIAGMMAAGAIETAAGHDVTKASEKLAKGKAAADAKAIDEYGKAWKEVAKVLKKAAKAAKEAAKAATEAAGERTKVEGSPPGGNSSGKYAVYTFHFVNLQTGDQLTVTGTNAPGTAGYTGKGNEGYLEVAGEIMQLHVSCSDAFTGGIGQKSDPSADSPWRVVDATIEKWKDGSLEKTCELVGLEMPGPDPDDDLVWD